MKTGTKSLLFGVHQFAWHPITVWLAWVWLYRKLPTWRECLCILVHDWGYWGCSRMDDAQGEQHPELGAAISGWLLGPDYYLLVLLHSRHLASRLRKEPSLLCWADKCSLIFDPWWFYLPRAWASGELFQYREGAARREVVADLGGPTKSASHREWYQWLKNHLVSAGVERRASVVRRETK